MQVRRALHDQLSQKEVWKSIFLSICRERALFSPSYGKIDEMSVLELIRAACGPYRWSQMLAAHHDRIKQQAGGQLTPFSSTKVPPMAGHKFQFFVPGGRYLVVFDSSNCLYLYDLGQVGRKPLDTPLVVAKLRPEESRLSSDMLCEVIGVGASSDEPRLRVGMVFVGASGQAECVWLVQSTRLMSHTYLLTYMFLLAGSLSMTLLQPIRTRASPRFAQSISFDLKVNLRRCVCFVFDVIWYI